MTLEQKLGEQEVNKLKGRPFGIDSSIKYDPNSNSIREEFVKKASDLFDVEDYCQMLEKNINDLGALNDLTGIALKYMPGDKDKNVEILREPRNALKWGKKMQDYGQPDMARFIENNRDEILKKMNEKQMFSLINEIELYPTGNQEHDRASYLIIKLKQLKKASQEQGEEGVKAVIGEELNELASKIPEEQMAFLQECPEMISSLTSGLIKKLKGAHGALFKKDGKNLDKNAMIKYLEANYEVIEDIMDDDKMSNDEKFNLWDKNLKNQYLAIARTLFPGEKKKYKRDKDEDKEDRKDKAKSVGART